MLRAARFRQALSRAGKDGFRRQFLQALQGNIILAARVQAWGAGDLYLKGLIRPAIRPGPERFGGTKQSDQRLAKRAGDVHWAGVIADHQVATANPLDHFGQRGLAGEIQAAFGLYLRQAFTQPFILR